MCFCSFKIYAICFVLETVGEKIKDASNDSQNNILGNTKFEKGDELYTVRPPTTILMETAKPNVHRKGWLIYASAVPTVMVFIICVFIIAIKNYCEERPYG